MTQPVQLLKTREVCQILGCCRKTLWNMRRRGELRPVRLGARSIRYRQTDVEKCERRLRPAR